MLGDKVRTGEEIFRLIELGRDPAGKMCLYRLGFTTVTGCSSGGVGRSAVKRSRGASVVGQGGRWWALEPLESPGVL